MIIQTDPVSLVLLALACVALGAGGAWVLLRLRARRKRGVPAEGQGAADDLYHMFSRLSHRLKTAGEVIRGHLHGFSDELPDDPERWRVARRAIIEESADISQLITRLDLVVRLGLKTQPLVIEPVVVQRVLEDLMVDLGPAAESRGVLLGGIVNAPGQTPVRIAADPTALREVFSILLENAVKHNGAGTLVTAAVDLRGDQVEVRISDTGRGIPADLVARMFEQGRGTYRPGSVNGTGMGLFLCRRLVEAQGGTLIAKSTEGAGTEFQMVLPTRRARGRRIGTASP